MRRSARNRTSASSRSRAPLSWNSTRTGRGVAFLATGTRNPIGLAFRPGTRTLWAAVQERDRLGDDLVPDYVTAIQDGGFYGWPYAYADQREDPRRKGERPDLVKKTIVPDVLIQAHSAVLGLAFYDGKAFPQEYRGRCVRCAARLLESLEAHRLQNHSHPLQGREARRRLRRLLDGLDAGRKQTGGLGPPRRPARPERRLDADYRRRSQQDLARHL